VNAGDDGIHAEYALAINGGTIDVRQSYEGVEGSKVYVTSGSTTICSTDDGIKRRVTRPPPARPWWQGGGRGSDDSAYLFVSGGVVIIDAPGGDGVDSNGDFDMTGGEVYISGPTNGGNGSIDYGDGATATITGAPSCAGASGMQETFGTSSSQASALVSLSGSAGGTITVSDASGTVLGSFVCVEDYDVVVVSCAGMVSGGSYTITAARTQPPSRWTPWSTTMAVRARVAAWARCRRSRHARHQRPHKPVIICWWHESITFRQRHALVGRATPRLGAVCPTHDKTLSFRKGFRFKYMLMPSLIQHGFGPVAISHRFRGRDAP